MMVFKDLFVVGSILGLILLGVAITLRSGLVASGRQRGSRLLSNLSQMLVALVSWAAFFSMVQQWVGLRLNFLP